MMNSNFISEILDNAKTVCITGHVKPDGDCIGSSLGLCNYLKDCYPQLEVDVYLDSYSPVYEYLRYEKEVRHEEVEGKVYDLFISVDSAEFDRIGAGRSYFMTAKRTVNIDHHVSNPKYAQLNHVVSTASAASEVLYDLFDKDKISKETAECLYTGISHDTGIFKYSNVTGNTMRAAADLIDKGIDFAWILNHTILEKEYAQSRFSGFCVYNSHPILDGKCVWAVATQKQMEEIGVTVQDTGGIVERLRDMKGADCAFFMYESSPDVYRVSMRSKVIVNVNQICAQFGGGGHVHAAGCTIDLKSGQIHTVEDIVNCLAELIQKQL